MVKFASVGFEIKKHRSEGSEDIELHRLWIQLHATRQYTFDRYILTAERLEELGEEDGDILLVLFPFRVIAKLLVTRCFEKRHSRDIANQSILCQG